MTLTNWNGTILGPYNVINLLVFLNRPLLKIESTRSRSHVVQTTQELHHSRNSLPKLTCHALLATDRYNHSKEYNSRLTQTSSPY